VFPDVDPSARLLLTRSMGHPLLPPAERVDNDVEVGPSGTFLLVTGSNMSGKSTLLRAIGVNLVLAGAGAPVCAASFRTPPLTLWTSMRVQDSLERGVSYFMAELQRLKQVVDAARAAADPWAVDGRDGNRREAGGRRFFYLLDEILQGTNTAERQIAARRIVSYLVESGAIGAVSTHDLTLAEAPALAAHARMVHFTESIVAGDDGPMMTFDYKLRPGIATSTNALRLMQIVGLDLGDEKPAVGEEQRR
jgi:DNA mismatch repair ATPase MutS